MLDLLRTRRRMHAYLGAQQRLGRFSGAVLVARGPRPLFRRGYGMADYAHSVRNTPQTAFRIGSQTKLFTAVAVLQLAELGALSLTEPLARFLPDYPGGERISLHHLLTNSSGIPDYIAQPEFTPEQGRPHTLEQLIARFRDKPALFPPGGSYAYSNSGWVLLGAVIERASGMSYGDYLRDRVLAPAGLRHSGLALGQEVVPGLAGGYLSGDAGPIRAAYLDNSLQHAAGGLHASADDLLRWWRALVTGRLLKPASLALLTSPHIETDYGPYGYGVALCEAHGRRYIESSGGTLGYVSVTAWYPDADLTVIVLANFENSPFNEIARDLAAIAFGEPYELPTGRRFITLDPAQLSAYEGRYRMSFLGRAHVLEVRREGDELMAEVEGLPAARLRPLSPTRFFAQMKGEVELEFPAGDGPAERIDMLWAGHQLTALRLEAT